MAGADSQNKRPPCYGVLETVFPPGPEGLRQSPPACMACRHKTDCLRQAINGQPGDIIADERIDRRYRAGQIGFWSRWSRKKQIARQAGDKRKG